MIVSLFSWIIFQIAITAPLDWQTEKKTVQQEALFYLELSGQALLYPYVLYSLKAVHGVLQISTQKIDHIGKTIEETSHLVTPEKALSFLQLLKQGVLWDQPVQASLKTHKKHQSKSKKERPLLQYELWINFDLLCTLQKEKGLMDQQSLAEWQALLKGQNTLLIFQELESQALKESQSKVLTHMIELFAKEEYKSLKPTYSYWIDQRSVGDNQQAIVSLRIDRPAKLKIDHSDYGVIEHELIFKQELGKHILTLCPMSQTDQEQATEKQGFFVQAPEKQGLQEQADCFDYQIHLEHPQLKLKLNLKLE